MVEKRLQGHDFEKGGPIRQYSLDFNGDVMHDGYFIATDPATDYTLTFTQEQTYPLYVQNATGEDSLVITGQNNVVLGSGITVDTDSSNTTYVNNLHVQGEMTVEPREGEVRYFIDTKQVMVYVNGEWIEPRPIYKESRWVRFKKWVSNTLSR